MNSVVLVGRLTKDPVLRYTPDNNRAVADFTIAVDRAFKRDEADFIRIVTWGKQAENVANYLSKGSRCAVQGSIQTGSYVDKNGVTRYTTDVVANQVEFLSKKSDTGQNVSGNTDLSELGNKEDLKDFDESDIPF